MEPVSYTHLYAFVGPSGTGKSYRAQMVAGAYNIKFIIDDGLLVKENAIVAGQSAKKAPTKIETIKKALFNDEKQKSEMQEAIILSLIHIFNGGNHYEMKLKSMYYKESDNSRVTFNDLLEDKDKFALIIYHYTNKTLEELKTEKSITYSTDDLKQELSNYNFEHFRICLLYTSRCV